MHPKISWYNKTVSVCITASKFSHETILDAYGMSLHFLMTLIEVFHSRGLFLEPLRFKFCPLQAPDYAAWLEHAKTLF